jgi:hypothetical protein
VERAILATPKEPTKASLLVYFNKKLQNAHKTDPNKMVLECAEIKPRFLKVHY